MLRIPDFLRNFLFPPPLPCRGSWQKAEKPQIRAMIVSTTALNIASKPEGVARNARCPQFKMARSHLSASDIVWVHVVCIACSTALYDTSCQPLLVVVVGVVLCSFTLFQRCFPPVFFLSSRPPTGMEWGVLFSEGICPSVLCTVLSGNQLQI